MTRARLPFPYHILPDLNPEVNMFIDGRTLAYGILRMRLKQFGVILGVMTALLAVAWRMGPYWPWPNTPEPQTATEMDAGTDEHLDPSAPTMDTADGEMQDNGL